jgi:Ni/Fe-hydrogenase b-type cytochrome subunit
VTAAEPGHGRSPGDGEGRAEAGPAGGAVGVAEGPRGDRGERLERGPITWQWVYLWHWPIRAMHWVAAAAVVTLIVTGFYIGRPYFLTSGEASSHFLMGWMRFLHFAAAGVFVATALVRFYWLFRGNRFERWRALFPVRREDWVHLGQVLKAYLFIGSEEAPQYMGHNPIQQFTYTGVYALAALQVVTGFAMYGIANPGGAMNTAFGWVGPLFGGWQIVRFVHHVATWLFIVFIPLHVYLTIRADVVHRESRVSSIVTGGRYVRADVDFVDE